MYNVQSAKVEGGGGINDERDVGRMLEDRSRAWFHIPQGVFRNRTQGQAGGQTSHDEEHHVPESSVCTLSPRGRDCVTPAVNKAEQTRYDTCYIVNT
jgi:hypothetical protein